MNQISNIVFFKDDDQLVLRLIVKAKEDGSANGS